jgi:predicted Zn finger-like uncharacterized protein
MIITCECQKYRFVVKAEDIGPKGRLVQCGMCEKQWFQEPPSKDEIKVLKDNYVTVDDNNEEEIKIKPKTKKETSKYVPVKYESESFLSLTKVFWFTLLALTLLIYVSIENKTLVLNSFPEMRDYYDLIQAVYEQILEKSIQFIDFFTPKPSSN